MVAHLVLAAVAQSSGGGAGSSSAAGVARSATKGANYFAVAGGSVVEVLWEFWTALLSVVKEKVPRRIQNCVNYGMLHRYELP